MQIPRKLKRGAYIGATIAVVLGLLGVAAAVTDFDGAIAGSSATGNASLFFATSSLGTGDGPTGQGDASGVVCFAEPVNNTALPEPPSTTDYANTLFISISNAFPGSVCTFKALVYSQDAALKLQDIVLVNTPSPVVSPSPSNVVQTFVPALGGDCGLAISGNSAAPTLVTFTVTAPAGATWVPGQQGEFSTGSNLQAVPAASYVSTSCT
jgi:hypothetical protein